MTRVQEDNSGSVRAHRHGGTVSELVSPLHPPFFSLLCSSNDKSLIIRTSCVTTAANGATLRFVISCAADFCITKHSWHLTSSPIVFHTAGKCSVTLRCFAYRNARSRSAPVAAAFTGTPPVTIETSSSTAPKPFKSREYRRMCVGSCASLYSKLFSLLCLKVVFSKFFCFFYVPLLYHAFCSVSTERHTIRKP